MLVDDHQGAAFEPLSLRERGRGEGPVAPRRINPPLPSRARNSAKRLLTASTDAERELWFRLRNRQFGGLKFRRQHPIPPYIADFYCQAAKLVVELDGSQHGKTIDRRRSEYFAAGGLLVLRFWDNDVLQNAEAVPQLVLITARERTLTPTPLPEGEGLQEQSA